MPYLSIRSTLLMIIVTLNILIASLVGEDVYASWNDYGQARILREQSFKIDKFYNANKNISLERATTLSAIYALDEDTPFQREELLKNRHDADTSLTEALEDLKYKDNTSMTLYNQIVVTFLRLKQLRHELDETLDRPYYKRDFSYSDKIFKQTTLLVSEIQKAILVYSRPYQDIDPAISRQMLFKYFVWELAEYASEEYAIIGKMIAEDKHPSADQQAQLLSLRGRIQYGWDILQKFPLNEDFSKNLLPYREEAQTHYFMIFDQIRDLFYTFQPVYAQASYPISLDMWLVMASQAVDSLLALQEQVLQETQRHLLLLENNYRYSIIFSILVFLCSLTLSFYCWSIILFRLARPVNAMVNALYKATRDEVYDMPVIRYKHDEIGKLMNVLESFQVNAVKMKRSNEELERFAYIAAHDLKSPLRAIDNISQWLEEDLSDLLKDEDKLYMLELRSRVRLMERLLDDTLEYARIGAKIADKPNIFITGKELISEIRKLADPDSEAKIEVSHRFLNVIVSKIPLQQVLYNLINNAIKHNDKNSCVIYVDIEEKDNHFVFIVRDDGSGIEERYHEKIFEMFQTLHSRDESKGRGMGLAIVKKIVTSLGGYIVIRSQLGHGSEFEFSWPKTEFKQSLITKERVNATRR